MSPFLVTSEGKAIKRTYRVGDAGAAVVEEQRRSRFKGQVVHNNVSFSVWLHPRPCAPTLT